MAFAPATFLDSVGISHEVKSGNHVFPCPWCGSSDLDGDNYGIRLDGKAWGCWRDRSHTGSLPWLLVKLSGWTFAQAKEYLETGAETSPLSDLRKRHEALGKKLVPAVPSIEIPGEFRSIRNAGPAAKFGEYLRGRGFEDPEHLGLRYDLRCALTGRFKDRIICPVFADDRLLGWTARTIKKGIRSRYIAHPDDSDATGVKDGLFNEPNCKGGPRLFIVEGPFDALKLDWFSDYRADAVALMGTSSTPAQTARLRKLAKLYETVVILLDRAARPEAVRLRASIPGIGARIAEVPEGAKDPGDLPPAAVPAFVLRA